MAYIDLYMVRAGVVAHPSDWPDGGCREIQHPPRRYRVIDIGMRMRVLHVADPSALVCACRQGVGSALREG